MPTFEAAEAAKDDPLRLPIPGRDGRVITFEIPVLSAQGLVDLSMIERAVRKTFIGLGDTVPAEEISKLDSMTNLEYVQLVLSAGTYGLMVDAGIDARMLTAACLTAQAWHTRGTQAAFDTWQRLAVHPGADDDPKAPKMKSGGGNMNPKTGS